jgi:Protein of unknown function (DUF3307)
MLFFLLAGHALMDFALQSDAMATCKCRRADLPLQKSVPWFYWLTAHALLHGAAVGVVVAWFGYAMSVAVGFAVAEAVVHWLADYAKCAGLFSIHVDQLIHVLSKVAWWALLAGGVVTGL